ncbi:MAG TPA: hypothetical protein VFS43_40040 [Polyangiaceae bacterium]|nr:hypothetical protein [Polyangiaceae bacterium]
MASAPSDPLKQVVRWQRQLAAAGQPPEELISFVAGAYPEAAQAAARYGVALRPKGVSPVAWATNSFLRSHVVFLLYFSWEAGDDFEVRSCQTSLGPTGLLALTGRLSALTDLFSREGHAFRPADAEILAKIMAPSVVGDRRPDGSALSTPVRKARIRSTLLDEVSLRTIDSGSVRSRLVPAEPHAWWALRPTLEAPNLVEAPWGWVETFSYLQGLDSVAPDGGSALFQLTRYTCAIDARTYSVRKTAEPLGQLWLRMP